MSALPSLPTLQAFEAVARRRSFALAANELNLSASAVSHQIARLESQLGVKLLDRTTAGVRINANGEYYLQRVQAAIGVLVAATKDVRQGLRQTLYVHASPSFASLWLMPRLADFAASFPDISLQLSASHVHSDFAASQVDLDIRYGMPRWPNLVVQPLFQEQIMPLASPALLKRHSLSKPEDVLRAPLIQSTISLIQWVDWLRAQDVDEHPATFSLRFDRAQLALDAAAQGLGIALESSTIGSPYLQSGRLLPVFGVSRSMPVEGHFMVYPQDHGRRAEVQVFTTWLMTRAQGKRPG